MIALSIRERTEDEVLIAMRWYSELTEIFELRIDYLRNKEPDLERLISYSHSISKPVIITNRHISESGHEANSGFHGSEQERIDLLQKALSLGADYVDIECRFLIQLKKRLPEQKIIVSYHNFEETPPTLETIRDKISDSPSADVVKIVASANSLEDSLRMLQAVSGNKKTSFTGLCTGKYGAITRVLGHFYGNFLTFATTENSPSSPGELRITALNNLIRKSSELPVPMPAYLSVRALMEYSSSIGLE